MGSEKKYIPMMDSKVAVIGNGRVFGKSFAMIVAASQSGVPIICATEQGEDRIIAQAKALALSVNTKVLKKKSRNSRFIK